MSPLSHAFFEFATVYGRDMTRDITSTGKGKSLCISTGLICYKILCSCMNLSVIHILREEGL